MSGRVAERTREVGIRSALGATSRDIVALVLGEGLALAGAGAAIGVATALAFSRLLGTLLFGVSPMDGVTYATVVGVLLAVALLACWLPARRATRVPPSIALTAP